MSPRLPRDVSGSDLTKLLEALGYAVSRQKDAHLGLTTQVSGEHHIAVPNHDSLRTGAVATSGWGVTVEPKHNMFMFTAERATGDRKR